MQPAAGIQLRWKSYLGDLRLLLQQLRHSEELTDVVLTNGSTSIRCHQVVLSAACQTFHDLLKEHAGDVVICLGGVDSSDLRSLVDYMYSGEVEVAPGRLGDFLALAAQWGVRGLGETARSARQQTEASDARGSTSERTVEDLPRVIEINSFAASSSHAIQRSESLVADSTSRWKGRPRPDDSDSSSEENNEPVALPAVAAVGSISRCQRRSPSTNSEEKSKSGAPSISKPQTSSAPDSAGNTKPPKVSKRTKSRKAEGTSVPDMFACPHCPRVFVKPTFFETHLKRKHNDRTLPEKCRVKLSYGPGRVVQLAGGILGKLPSTTTKKRKTAQPKNVNKRKKTAEVPAAEPTLEQVAHGSGRVLSEATLASGSAEKAPAKRGRMIASKEDCDSASSVEELPVAASTAGPASGSTEKALAKRGRMMHFGDDSDRLVEELPVAASTSGPGTIPARPPLAPLQPQPAPAAAPWPPEDVEPIVITIPSVMDETLVGIGSHVRRKATDRDDPRPGQDPDHLAKSKGRGRGQVRIRGQGRAKSRGQGRAQETSLARTPLAVPAAASPSSLDAPLLAVQMPPSAGADPSGEDLTPRRPAAAPSDGRLGAPLRRAAASEADRTPASQPDGGPDAVGRAATPAAETDSKSTAGTPTRQRIKSRPKTPNSKQKQQQISCKLRVEVGPRSRIISVKNEQDVLETVRDLVNDSKRNQGIDCIDKFWNEYSQFVERLVAAGEEGGEEAKKVAMSVKEVKVAAGKLIQAYKYTSIPSRD